MCSARLRIVPGRREVLWPLTLARGEGGGVVTFDPSQGRGGRWCPGREVLSGGEGGVVHRGGMEVLSGGEGGVVQWGGRCCPGEVVDLWCCPPPPPGVEVTHACENITFARFAVIIGYHPFYGWHPHIREILDPPLARDVWWLPPRIIAWLPGDFKELCPYRTRGGPLHVSAARESIEFLPQYEP